MSNTTNTTTTQPQRAVLNRVQEQQWCYYENYGNGCVVVRKVSATTQKAIDQFSNHMKRHYGNNEGFEISLSDASISFLDDNKKRMHVGLPELVQRHPEVEEQVQKLGRIFNAVNAKGKPPVDAMPDFGNPASLNGRRSLSKKQGLNRDIQDNDTLRKLPTKFSESAKRSVELSSSVNKDDTAKDAALTRMAKVEYRMNPLLNLIKQEMETLQTELQNKMTAKSTLTDQNQIEAMDAEIEKLYARYQRLSSMYNYDRFAVLTAVAFAPKLDPLPANETDPNYKIVLEKNRKAVKDAAEAAYEAVLNDLANANVRTSLPEKWTPELIRGRPERLKEYKEYAADVAAMIFSVSSVASSDTSSVVNGHARADLREFCEKRQVSPKAHTLSDDMIRWVCAVDVAPAAEPILPEMGTIKTAFSDAQRVVVESELNRSKHHILTVLPNAGPMYESTTKPAPKDLDEKIAVLKEKYSFE